MAIVGVAAPVATSRASVASTILASHASACRGCMSADVRDAARALRLFGERTGDGSLLQRATEESLGWLLRQPATHWYCSREWPADEDERERRSVLVFVLRLLSFKVKDGDLRSFRDRLHDCLASCTDCVEGFLAARAEYETTWLPYATTRHEVEAFTDGFVQREHERLRTVFETAARSEASSGSGVNQLPVGLLHYILSSPWLYADDGVQSRLAAACQLDASPVVGLPKRPSAGLFAFAIHRNGVLRSFAHAQLTLCASLTSNDFLSLHRNHAITLLLGRAMGRHPPGAEVIVDDSPDLWQGLHAIADRLDADALAFSIETGKARTQDEVAPTSLLRYVCSHLGDRRTDALLPLLDLWRVLLDRCQRKMWDEEDVDYADVVLSSLLDSPAFEDTLINGSSAPVDMPVDGQGDEPPDPRLFAWLLPFLRSVAHSAQLFPSALGSIALVLLDRFQNARFSATQRSAAALACVRVFRCVFTAEKQSGDAWPHVEAARNQVLDVYAGILSELAFGKAAAKAAGALNDVAAEVADLLLAICDRDSRLVCASVLEIAGAGAIIFRRRIKEKSQDEAAVVPRIEPVALRLAIWKRMHDTVRSSRSTWGVATLLRGLEPALHLDFLTNTVYNRPQRPQDEAAVRPAMKAVNNFFTFARQPLVEALHDIADSDTSRISHFLVQPGTIRVTQILTESLFAPANDFYNAAISVVRNAFDVVSRADCLRSLLQNAPMETIRGLCRALAVFKSSGEILLAPIDNASRLARGLGDTIDVLCDHLGGLLRDATWVRVNHLQKPLGLLWRLICDALALIYRKTVEWAQFYDSQNMVAWMRDAVMLGDALVDEVQIFAAVTSGDRAQDTAERQDRELVGALNAPFDDVLSWVRLNDRDLLSLVKALLSKMIDRFIKSSVALSTPSIKRIIRYATREQSESTMLETADFRGFCIALSRHPAHSDAIREMPELGVTSESRPAPAGRTPQHAERPLQRGKKVVTIDVDADEPVSIGGPPKFAPKMPAKGHPKTFPVPHGQKGKDGKSNELLTLNAKPSKSQQAPEAKAKPQVRPAQQLSYSHDAVRKRREQLDYSGSESDEEVLEGAGLGVMATEAPERSSRSYREAKRQVRQLDVVDVQGRSANRSTRSPNAPDRGIRMRLAPDLSSLHRTILQWDFTVNSSVPPIKPPRAGEIPADFKSADDYIKFFEPMLLLETWQQLMRAKEDVLHAVDSPPIPCVIAGQQSVDDFNEIFLVIAAGDIPEKGGITEADLTVLKSGASSVLAKVQSLQRKRDRMDITVRCHFGQDRQGASYAMNARSQVELIKLMSLSTTHREYTALTQVGYLTLANDILNPRLHKPYEATPAEIQHVMSSQRINEPQASAVISVLRTPGVSLIQGPPGTGKTSTILALVGALASKKIDVKGSGGHILLCAPSNAAVDEIVKRLKDGVRRPNGSFFTPQVVRVGAESAVNLNVRDVFIDVLVEGHLNRGSEAQGKNTAASLVSGMRAEIGSLKEQRNAKQVERNEVANNAALTAQLDVEIRDLRRKIADLGVLLDSERDKQTQTTRAMDAERRKVRQELLTSADIICATLSGSGHDYMAQLGFDFETVIIDEAAQSVELSSLIPLKYGCKRCILVGDPFQLPPTVLSRVATEAGYDQSLFVRILRQNSKALHLLSIQYRMHPQISAFPSHEFYEGQLRDGKDMAVKTEQPWHASALYAPYCFMHVKNGAEQQSGSHSIMNREEAAMAVALYDGLLKSFPRLDLDFRVGVITTYRAQLLEIRKQFRQRFGQTILQTVDFNTVDGFQGQEKDLIILSCVRGSPDDTKGSIGFLSDFRRMNVALTRARSSLYILGNATALERNGRWGRLIKNARDRGCFREVDRSTFARSQPTPASRKVSLKKSPKSSDTPRKDSSLATVLSSQDLSQSLNLRSPTSSGKRKASVSRSGASADGASPTITKKSRNDEPVAAKASTAGKAIQRLSNGSEVPALDAAPPGRSVGRMRPPPATSLFIPKPNRGRGRAS